MRIERIRIDKFGGLRGFEMELGPGCTVLLGGNESGKTTVCAFLRAMLYGLNGKSASLAQNERKKYMPWGETAMGGSVRLCDGGDCYEITRVFGQTKKSDTCSVINVVTGEVMNLPVGREPGEILLGLTESVYLDTLYMTFRGGRISGGAQLAERMRNRVDTGDEEVNLARVKERLTAARNAIYPRIREKGALAAVRRELDAERQKLMQEENLKKQAEALQGKLKQVPKERSDALQRSMEETDRRIRAQEERLIAQEKQENGGKKAVWLFALLAVFTAVLSVIAGALLSAYAFAGLLPAACCAAFAANISAKRRRVQRANVDAVLGELSLLRQDQAMLRMQMEQLRGGETEEMLLRDRLALEKVRQELAQIKDVKARIRQLEAREKALLSDIQALDIALEEMQEAEKERREGLTPRLRQEMEDMLCGLTGARYAHAAIAEDMALLLQSEGGQMRQGEYFSGGTVEQMYLALRLSLVRQLEETHGKLPMLLDDPLAQYDDARAEDALELLRSFAAEGRQVLLLTCRARDAQGAERVVRMETCGACPRV